MGRERGFQSFALHPQFGRAGNTRLRQALHVDRQHQHDAATRLHARRRQPHASHGAVRMDREDSRRRHVRRRAAARDAAPGAAVCQPQRRPHELQSERRCRKRRSSACCTSASPTAAAAAIRSTSRRTSARRSARFSASIRSGSNSANGKYGIPPGNPFVGKPGVLGEIYVYGVRNPQRFGWDPRNGNLFVADIGQNIVEELSVAPAGANLGWNKWEGSFGFISREAVSLTNRRGDSSVTYPVVEYGQLDPLLQTQSAVTGVHVYRHNADPATGEPRAVRRFPERRDLLYSGGQAARRVVRTRSAACCSTTAASRRRFCRSFARRTPNRARPQTSRADLRFGAGPDGQVFLLNKHDGTIRLLVPDSNATRR